MSRPLFLLFFLGGMAGSTAGAAANAISNVGPGRPRKLDAAQRRAAVEMVRSGERTPADVARLMKVHPSTIARLVQSDEQHRRSQGPLPPAP